MNRRDFLSWSGLCGAVASLFTKPIQPRVSQRRREWKLGLVESGKTIGIVKDGVTRQVPLMKPAVFHYWFNGDVVFAEGVSSTEGTKFVLSATCFETATPEDWSYLQTSLVETFKHGIDEVRLSCAMRVTVEYETVAIEQNGLPIRLDALIRDIKNNRGLPFEMSYTDRT